MDYKEEFKRLLKIVKDKRKQSGFGYRNEDIATSMGYSRSHFSTLMGEKGVITPEHLKILILHFPWLEKQTKFRLDQMFENQTDLNSEGIGVKANKEKSTDEKSLLELLMQQMANLMQTQNNLLQEQKEQVVDKVKEVDTNLKRALQGVSKLVLHVESARVVVLDSLSRLEKRPGSLRKEADKIMDQLEGQQMTHGISSDDGN